MDELGLILRDVLRALGVERPEGARRPAESADPLPQAAEATERQAGERSRR
jgi:hypothetical protein